MTLRRLVGIEDPSDTLIRGTALLGVTEYAFELRFNEREGDWIFRLATLDGEVIVEGLRCATGRDLLGNVFGAGAIGALIVQDPSGAHREAGALTAWADGLRLVWDDGEDEG